MVNIAASDALINDFSVTLAIFLFQLSGSNANPFSIGVPIKLVIFTARPGFSNSDLATKSSFVCDS